MTENSLNVKAAIEKVKEKYASMTKEEAEEELKKYKKSDMSEFFEEASVKTIYPECKRCLEERIPPMTLDQLILEAIYQSLKRNNWIREWSAHELMISIRTLHNYIKKLKTFGYKIEESQARFIDNSERRSKRIKVFGKGY